MITEYAHENVGKVTTQAACTQSVSRKADEALNNMKEAQMILDTLFNNIFGPRMEKEQEVPKPPVDSLKAAVELGAEQSRIITNRLAELNDRLFGG